MKKGQKRIEGDTLKPGTSQLETRNPESEAKPKPKPKPEPLGSPLWTSSNHFGHLCNFVYFN